MVRGLVVLGLGRLRGRPEGHRRLLFHALGGRFGPFQGLKAPGGGEETVGGALKRPKHVLDLGDRRGAEDRLR